MSKENENMEQALLQGRRYNFFMVGNDIADTEELDIYEKAVCYQIARYSNAGNVAFPSYSTLAKKCRMSKRKAMYAVKSLVEKGVLIKVVRKKIHNTGENKNNNDTNLYALNDNLYRILENTSKTSDIKTSEEGSAPHASGGSAPHALGVVHEMHPKNKDIINNIYIDELDSLEEDLTKASSDKKSDVENKHTKSKTSPKKQKKDLSKFKDTVYDRIITHFNSLEGTDCKPWTKKFVENIDILLTGFTEEEIIAVTDYVKNYNYNPKYFNPISLYKLDSFSLNHGWMQDKFRNLDTKKACTTKVQAEHKTYYIVRTDLNKVIASPVEPQNIDANLVFTDKLLAEAKLQELT